jgi:hypothetical protein
MNLAVVTAASASNILGILVAGGIAVRLHRTSAALAGSACRKLIAIAFIAASLFLAISTSDDLARFAFLQPFTGAGSSAGMPSGDDPAEKSNTAQFVRVLDAMSTALIAQSFVFQAVLIASGVVAFAA